MHANCGEKGMRYDATAKRTQTTIVVSLLWSSLTKDGVVTSFDSMSSDSANLERAGQGWVGRGREKKTEGDIGREGVGG